MSVQSEIDRIAGAKTTLGDYLTQNGQPVAAGETIDTMAAKLANVNEKQDILLASGASVGDLIKVAAVDANGKPTAWAVCVPGTDYMKTGNITKQTLVASEATPTEDYAINWHYE